MVTIFDGKSAMTPAGMYILCILLPVLGSVTAYARLSVRRRKCAKLGADDWSAFAGLVFLWGIAALGIVGTAKGIFGTHTLVNPKTGQNVVTWRERHNVKYQWTTLSLTIIALTLIKISVMLLYRRIFQISRRFNIYSIVLMVLLVLWGISFFFANVFQCGTHPSAEWTNLKMILKYCDDFNSANVAFCISDLIMDIMILASPISMVWRMRLPLAQKCQVLGIFGLGFLSTAASAVRLYIMAADAYSTQLGYRDLVAMNTVEVTWCIVEVATALIASCLPVLGPLFRRQSLQHMTRGLHSLLTFGSPKESQHRVPDTSLTLDEEDILAFTQGMAAQDKVSSHDSVTRVSDSTATSPMKEKCRDDFV